MSRFPSLSAIVAAAVVVAAAPAWAAAPAGANDDTVNFFRWIETDNASGVERLLKAGFDPNTRDDKGQVGLFVALRAHSLQAAKVLWESSGTQIDAANAANETPLMIAAMRGETEAAQALIAHGAAVNRAGWSPLHYAATGGSAAVEKLLLARGAAIEARSPNNSTPLMMAAKYGSEEAVDALLAAGADLRARNDLGLDASGFAASAGRDKLATRLKAAAPGS
jgi:ankyrin repeat protein